MPLTQQQREQFATVLTELNVPEAARNILVEQAEATPALVDGYLRQSDYSRLSAKAAQQEKAAKDLYESNDRWFKETKPKLDQANAEAEALRTQLAAAGTGQGGDVDVAKVEAIIAERLKGIQAPTQEQRAKVTGEEVKRAVDAAAQQALPGIMAYAADMGDVAMQHRSEFKQPLDRIALSNFMREHQIAEIGPAYDKFAESLRTAAQTRQAAIDTQVAEQVQRELAKRAALNPDVPGSGAMPTGTLGPVQQYRSGQMPVVPGAPDNARLGDFSAAAAAAGELATEGRI